MRPTLSIWYLMIEKYAENSMHITRLEEWHRKRNIYCRKPNFETQTVRSKPFFFAHHCTSGYTDVHIANSKWAWLIVLTGYLTLEQTQWATSWRRHSIRPQQGAVFHPPVSQDPPGWRKYGKYSWYGDSVTNPQSNKILKLVASHTCWNHRLDIEYSLALGSPWSTASALRSFSSTKKDAVCSWKIPGTKPGITGTSHHMSSRQNPLHTCE